jgi:hypothetical protein
MKWTAGCIAACGLRIHGADVIGLHAPSDSFRYYVANAAANSHHVVMG